MSDSLPDHHQVLLELACHSHRISKGINSVIEEIVYVLKLKIYWMCNSQRRDGQYVLLMYQCHW